MGGLLFECPDTNQLFESGIKLDDRTYKVVAGYSVRLRCPCCNSLHDFQMEQAELEEAA